MYSPEKRVLAGGRGHRRQVLQGGRKMRTGGCPMGLGTEKSLVTLVRGSHLGSIMGQKQVQSEWGVRKWRQRMWNKMRA